MLTQALTIYGQKLNFRTYDLENDLGVNGLLEIESSSKGYLYLANNEQVFLFDGNDAAPLSTDYSLPFSQLSSLTEDSEARLILLANNQLIFYGQETPIISEKVNAFLLLADLIVYGTDAGVKIYNKLQNLIDGPEALSVLRNAKVHDVLLQDEIIYIASEIGLYIYDMATDDLEDFSASSPLNLTKLMRGENNQLWGYNGSGSICNIDLKSKKIKTYPNENFYLTSMEMDSSGRLWFGTARNGILQYDGRQDIWKTINSRSGIADNRIVDLHCDSWGVMWIASADGTLAKFIDKDYELYNVYDGLPSDEVTALSSGERLLLASGSKGIYEYEGGEIAEVYALNVKSEAILADSVQLWIGTNGSGLIQVADGESTVFGKNAGLPSNWVNRLAQDAAGNLWIGTPASGLAMLEKRDSSAYRVRVYGTEEGLSDVRITALLAHRSGLVYVGAAGGNVGRISNGVYYAMSLGEEINDEITDIKEGAYGDVYVGTAGAGVFKIGGGKKAGIQRVEGALAQVKSLAFYDDALHMVSEKGIFTSKTEFRISDGFPSSKVVNSGTRTYDGRIWMASKDGLISVGPMKKSSVRNTPKIFLENVQVDYNPIPYQRGGDREVTRVDYNENQISFEYQGVNIHSNKDAQYSYILAGRDKMWSPWTKNDNTSFNNLRAGAYTFQVMAKSQDGAESEAISHEFIIDAPIWKEWWFMSMIVLLSAVIVLLIFKYRIRNVRRKNEEEKTQLEMKNRLLELEQKANQLQMNPHFIFNALNSIQATVAKEDYQDARREITDFAVLMRSILSNSKERTISLEDELKLLHKYISIEKKCRGLDFSYEITLGEGVNAEEAMIPPMLIQPFVENAIVHGLKGGKGGNLVVDFSLLKDDLMQVVVQDNGVGYVNSRAISVRKKHKSVAIEVTKERLETLLDKEYHPVLEIQQLADEGGTRVTLKMPVEYDY